ncbi:cyanate permease [Schleiferia thermophila]|uniref:Cyanate permease n=1 Tax=Schleiferia thermophila TaxID=884107 RepID=A0A369A6S8_9FLAO|nr:cyanate permease [Schleiferia thermophila]
MVSRSLLLAGFVMVTFANQAMWVTFAPVASQVAAKLQVEVRWVGFLPVLYPVVFLLLSIPAGKLADMDAVKWVMIAGVLTAIGATVRFAGFNLFVLYFSQFLAAVAQPLILNGFVPLTKLYSQEKRSVVLTTMSVSMYSGIAFSLLAGVPVYSTFGITGLILPAAVLSVIGLVVLICAHRFLSTGPATPSSVNTGFGSVVCRPFVMVFGCILGLGVGTFDNLSTWLEPALSSTNFSHHAGQIMGIAISAGVIGVGVISPAVARYRWHIGYLKFVLVFVLLSMVLLTVYPKLVVFYILIITSSVLMFPAYPLIMEMVAERFLQGGLAAGAVGMVSRVVTVTLTLLASAYIGDASLFFRFLSIPLLAGVALITLWNDTII